MTYTRGSRRPTISNAILITSLEYELLNMEYVYDDIVAIQHCRQIMYVQIRS